MFKRGCRKLLPQKILLAILITILFCPKENLISFDSELINYQIMLNQNTVYNKMHRVKMYYKSILNERTQDRGKKLQSK